MSLKLVSLASGSKGNATLIFSDSTAILVDAGISYTRLTKELKDFGLTPDMLDGVVITHEHSDHVSGLPKLCEVCDVYVHDRTAREIFKRQGALKRVASVDHYECGFEIGDIKVVPFRIPHDAEYPLAYSFECGHARCSVATDIGVPTVGVLRNIRESSVVLLESNHDLTMLKEGKYPHNLKTRILSNNGHLSNDSCARIAQLLLEGSEVQTLVLGHISQNNNTEELAYRTVSNMLKECNNTQMDLYLAHQDRRSEVFEII